MKKIVASLLFVAIAATAAYPFKLGIEFSAGASEQIGANLRFNDLFEFKPQIGFSFSDDDNRFNLLLDGNFYLPDIEELHHYAGFGLGMFFQTDTDGRINLNGHYGLRYDVNDIVSLFGEGGLSMVFDPFVMATFKGGVGCTFYIPGF